MAEEYLQVAFEIKAACDDISRKLLRWHWEHKPGAHSFDALMQHLARRQKESPDYYQRLPEAGGRSGWQQLDTTLCMRVLLDPEQDSARPLDLLGDTPRPAAARRACNAVRMARNEAAHASDQTAATQAALRFNEAVEELEAGYSGTALTTAQLSQYYRQAEEFLARCGGAEPAAQPRRPSPKPASRKGSGSSRPASGGQHSSRQKTTRSSANARRKKRQRSQSRALTVVLLAMVLLGLLVRAWTMGLLK